MHVTAFDLFTFFRADFVQSEASWKLSSTSDRLVNVCMKECELIKGDHTFGLLAVTSGCVKNQSTVTIHVSPSPHILRSGSSQYNCADAKTWEKY